MKYLIMYVLLAIVAWVMAFLILGPFAAGALFAIDGITVAGIALYLLRRA